MKLIIILYVIIFSLYSGEKVSFPMSIYISSRKNSGISNLEEFLAGFNENLKNIKYEIIKEPKTEKNKTCFYDNQECTYKIYDYQEFNVLLLQEYKKKYLTPRLLKNDIFKEMHACLDNLVSDQYDTKVFLSFFFRALRRSKVKSNLYDLEKLKLEFQNEFLDKYIEILISNGIFFLGKNLLLEINSSLEEIINLSFDTPKLGSGDIYIQVKTNYDFEFASDYTKQMATKENDFIFHYILASYTNCVTLDLNINNIYIDSLKKKEDFYKYL